MKLTVPEKNTSDTNRPTIRRRERIGHLLRSWLFTWELYPILFIAGFLRLYRLDTSEFDDDQARIFRMAHDALVHGLLPATSNIASIRIVNPPAVVYLLMLSAAISANPLWGVVLVGLFNTAAVLFTYIFVRRYYGRIAGIIAALLYAVATKPIHYSRFLWQQNMIAPLVVLFMFALFWGVVERRKGWLFPALLLLGIMIQLHESTILLVIPLLAALVLAPGTLRWRDLALGIISLCIIFSTYLLWEVSTRFADLYTILKLEKLPSKIDNQAFLDYRFFLSPYGLNPFDVPPANTHSLLGSLLPMLKELRRLMLLLVLAGFATVGISLILPRLSSRTSNLSSRTLTNVGTQFIGSTADLSARLLAPWASLRNSPYKCGLILLLIWQLVPLLILSRHSVTLYPYYLLMLMPGPFILIGLFFARLGEWLQRPVLPWRVIRYAVYAFAGLVIILQLIASTAGLIDAARGTLGHGTTYNDLESLQNALNQADQLAQQRHLNHLYIATDSYTHTSFGYLAEQLHTPTTLFDASNCLVLPNLASGPAVLLTGPSDSLATAMLKRFATATLVDQPKRLGSVPFQLYIVTPLVQQVQPSLPQFAQNLQLLDRQARTLHYNNTSWLLTYWGLLRSESPNFGTTYNYALTASPTNKSITGKGNLSICSLTSMRIGDQLLVAFNSSAANTAPSSLTIQADFSTTTPYIPSYGPLHLETIGNQTTPPTTLQTAEGNNSITLPVT